MRLEYNNTSVMSVSLQELEENLRLPSGMDQNLLSRLIFSATDYVESMANICLVDKDVKVSYIGPLKFYNLKWKVEEIISVKVNGVSLSGLDYVLYNNTPGYIQIISKVNDDDMVEIEYKALGKNDNYKANELVIAYASAMYNNPEGLDELDMKRINNRLQSISPI